MIQITVSGATGRMGRTVGRLIGEADDLEAIGGIAPDAPPGGSEAIGYPEVLAVDDARHLIERADAIIDFSAPDQVARILDLHADALAGTALLVGTTGLTDDLTDALDQLAERSAVLVAANFSVGITLLMDLVAQAARTLPADRYDIEIVERHHRLKEDAPSGTALALGEAAAEARGASLDDSRVDGRRGRVGRRPQGEIGLHAVRGGDGAGQHTVHLLGDGERITIGHTAGSRALFADGALMAARWLAGRSPGRYTMRQVLGLS